jgi:hypothetical protein
MNNVRKHLEFKLITEESKIMNYLDLSIHRDNNNNNNNTNNNLQLQIYRNPAQTDITIQFTSSHPLEYKLTTYNFYINRMLSAPITEQARMSHYLSHS